MKLPASDWPDAAYKGGRGDRSSSSRRQYSYPAAGCSRFAGAQTLSAPVVYSLDKSLKLFIACPEISSGAHDPFELTLKPDALLRRELDNRLSFRKTRWRLSARPPDGAPLGSRLWTAQPANLRPPIQGCFCHSV